VTRPPECLAYLRELAEPALSRPRPREPELAGPALVRLMDGWSPTPALTLGRYWTFWPPTRVPRRHS
jgi:hypothetical protein